MSHDFSSYTSSSEALQGSYEHLKYLSMEVDLKLSLCTLTSYKNKVKLMLENTLHLRIYVKI